VEAKIVQRATAEGLNAIAEEDGRGGSSGGRPGRSPHNARDAVTVGSEQRNVNWMLDAAIRGCFDTLDQEWLVKCAEQRIGDRRVVRHLRKGLQAGVLEEGQWRA
jgi:retron-type reverse transcriptase